MRWITACGVEEHQIGWCVVQERRQHTGGPEVHGRVGRAIAIGHGTHYGAKRAIHPSLEHGNDGNDGQKDACKQLGYLLHGSPTELIGLVHRCRCELEREQGHQQQAHITHQTRQADMGSRNLKACRRAPDAAEQHQSHHHRQQRKVHAPFKAQATLRSRHIHARGGIWQIRLAFLAHQLAVKHIEDSQQCQGQKQHGLPDMAHRPEKVHALQKAQEQGRITQRSKRTTGVGDDEDEEHHHMGLMTAIVIGT